MARRTGASVAVSFSVIALATAACRGPVGPALTEDRTPARQLSPEDRSLGKLRATDRGEEGAPRGLERRPPESGRSAPVLATGAIAETIEAEARTFTQPEGPTPDDEVVRVGGEAGTDVGPPDQDRPDLPRGTGEQDLDSGDGRPLPR